MLNFLGLWHNVDIRIVLDDEDTRRYEETKNDTGQINQFPIYYDGETVSGQVLLGLKRGSKLEHQGIRIELVGCVEFSVDRGSPYDFLSLTQDLARPGILSQPTAYPFEFTNVVKSHETYRGTLVHLRYFLRVTVQRRLTDLTKERELAVHTLAYSPDTDEGIHMEVGVENSLHIEFQYNKSKYHLRDVIIGKICFLLVRVKIKNMEVQILKRETIGCGQNMCSESETVAKYEVMDGAPVRGESIPIRLFLQSYSLSSTMRDVQKKFSVRYFINLVLLDEDDRRYYKQQEIVLYRRPDKRLKTLQNLPRIPAVPSPPNGDSTPDVAGNIDPCFQRPDSVDHTISETHNNYAQDGLKESAPSTSNGTSIPSNGEPDLDVFTSGSPDDHRTSRSMHRYEPKPRDMDTVTPCENVSRLKTDGSSDSSSTTSKQQCTPELVDAQSLSDHPVPDTF